jgi:ATP-dependent helicase HrpA
MADARVEEIRRLLPRALLSDWVRLGSRLVRLLRDRHHSVSHEAILDRLLAQARASVALRQERLACAPAVSYPAALPITARKDEIVAAIRSQQVVVVAGETGSGKTTQLPKMCLEAGLGIEAKIGCTQPRRIAALSISRRIADELDVRWGREVGCKIRFDDRSGAETYIKLMTDGILLAETQGDPLLSEYNAIIIDEAHERSLNIDFLLGYLKRLLGKRPDLKLIITSATIDTAAFSRAFGNAPVIEVSGRMYPVEVVYAPFDAASEESGDMTYIDAAVRAAERVLCEPGSGDVLMFMPGERDIRETTDLLKGRYANDAEVIPLFGRLSAGEQQRVFMPGARRKIVVATNIAETSLTIPGIRYVIDSGLARLSRYDARTRTRRLPIEPIAQSSANQRKGRAGRVQDGVCIRLYAEEDFAERQPYTPPEIQRSNLAEIILRMKAFRLGEIETFPFINPPSPAAIQGGYDLLHELGALDGARELTGLGGDLARLPIDPTLGRMVLQAQREHATREVLIIAAGLSIQDPRERPLDRKDAAAAAHKRFADPQSDFLTLLNIWNAVHDQWEALRTQNQQRKFCRANFLSYLRMREWQDLHAQLQDVLEELGRLKINESNAAYEAIHRSILAGLLGHVATHKEPNLYQAAGNREVNVFPGSAMFTRAPKPRKGKARSSSESAHAARQPEWIMAGEIVETSQRFARTVAGIDPLWIADLAPHVCKTTHLSPHWSASAGRVLVEELMTLYGLEVRRRKVAHGNINSKEATEIFIRGALVEEGLFPESPKTRDEEDEDESKLSASQLLASANVEQRRLPASYRFLEHNHQVRQKIETWQTRTRDHGLPDLDDALFDFYVRHLENVSSIHELNQRLRERADPNFLCVTEADLTGGKDLSFDAEAFPDSVSLGDQAVPLSYAYCPGESHDGVTLKLNSSLAQGLSPAVVEWAVPGLRENQVAELLRSLPKSLRRQLMPVGPKVAEITRDLQPGGPSLKHALARFIRERYGVEIPPAVWPAEALPQHLRPRIEVLDYDDKTLVASRDLNQLKRQLETAKSTAAGDPPGWARLVHRWERFGLTGWTFGDLPERVTDDRDTPPVSAWPGLRVEEGHVNLRLFRSPASARLASVGGIQRLVELALEKDLAWLQKDLRALARLEPLCRTLYSAEGLQAAAYENLRRYFLPREPFPALAEEHFRAAVDRARGLLPGLALQLSDRLETILNLRRDLVARCAKTAAPASAVARKLSDLKPAGHPPPTPARPGILERGLANLLPENFLERIPFEQLPQIPRYLKALLTRAERAGLNPAKDLDRARQVLPYHEALQRLLATPPETPAARQQLEKFRWMVEEFKVSVFAQELGTAVPVSPQRLDLQLECIRQATE